MLPATSRCAQATDPEHPAQALRVRLDVNAGDKLSLGADLLASSAIACAATRTTGRARQVPAMSAQFRRPLAGGKERRGVRRINNVFDRQYSNFGVLGNNVFANPARTFDPATARRALPRRRDAAAPGWACARNGREPAPWRARSPASHERGQLLRSSSAEPACLPAVDGAEIGPNQVQLLGLEGRAQAGIARTPRSPSARTALVAAGKRAGRSRSCGHEIDAVQRWHELI
jgi:hypothetical protein